MFSCDTEHDLTDGVRCRIGIPLAHNVGHYSDVTQQQWRYSVVTCAITVAQYNFGSFAIVKKFSVPIIIFLFITCAFVFVTCVLYPILHNEEVMDMTE
jgi:hypothetical protein